MSKERKEKENIIHRQAQCSCGFCGTDHESTIAEPNRSFQGRDETIGIATNGAAADAMSHMQELDVEITNYQQTYTTLSKEGTVTFKDNNSKVHEISVVSSK